MQKARDIKRRIGSVDNTRKITRTMEMVATSKLRRAQQRVLEARPYSAKLKDVIARLVTPELAELQPLLRQPEATERAAVVLVTSNRGLCGAFNANLIRTTQALVADLEEAGASVELHVYGKKGIAYFRFRGVEMAEARTDLTDRPGLEDAQSVIESISGRFVSGDLDAAYLVFAEFRNMVSTPPAVRKVLPVEVPERTGPQPYYILDPSAAEILSSLLPLYVTNSSLSALLETAAAEQAARRTAMKNATDNAEDFLSTLRRTYNRARQAEITQQIAEIMGGAEALAG
jgi:F-type H+-transporting ATPase subunit gamma